MTKHDYDAEENRRHDQWIIEEAENSKMKKRIIKLEAEVERLKEIERAAREVLGDIKTMHLDMSGKHFRYVTTFDAHKSIEPLRQLLRGVENE